MTQISRYSMSLTCPKCGNGERFIEVMKEESHLVDGSLTYIKLVDAIPDHYVCVECHETIPADSLDSR